MNRSTLQRYHSLTPAMRTHDVPGYILRTEAVKKYGRSKASFIRDFDRAFENGDTEFLENFRLYLNDDTMVPGPEASKEKMNSLQAMQPWVYIKEALLESRYWESQGADKTEAPKKAKQVSQREEGSEPVPKLTGVSDVVQLEHENAVLKTKLSAQDQTIETLRSSNTFLQDELVNRRGELKEMKELVDSMRLGLEAGKKPNDEPVATQRQDRRAAGSDVVDADAKQPERNVVDVDVAGNSFWKKHTPTLHRIITRS